MGDISDCPCGHHGNSLQESVPNEYCWCAHCGGGAETDEAAMIRSLVEAAVTKAQADLLEIRLRTNIRRAVVEALGNLGIGVPGR